MDAVAPRPSLLSAAKNFVRKSAGTAVLAIAPLAAVAIAPEAKAVAFTTFGTPGINIGYGTGSALVYSSFPSGSKFHFPDSVSNNLTTTRLGVDGTFFTSGSGVANITMTVFSSISGFDIPGSTVIPLAYDFTLNKQAGLGTNISWHLAAQIAGSGSLGYTVLGSGIMSGGGTANYTGTGNFTTLGNVTADTTLDFEFVLTLGYSSLVGDLLAVQMNSASQGYTINAVPEPSTYAILFGLGALGLVIVRRSRRAAA